MCIAAAIGGAALAGVAGAAIQGNAAESAASTQAGAAENAQQIQQQEFNTITGQEQPFMNAGYGALNALEYGLGIGGGAPGNTGMPPDGRRGGGRPFGDAGFGMSPQVGMGAGGGAGGPGYGALLKPFDTSDWQQLSPAYGFQREQGQQGTLNMDATSQGALSGAAQKDLMGFNQNLANTSFNNAFNMYQTQQGNIYQRLAGLTQLGQSAAANTGQQGTALAGNMGQAAQNVGTALAGGTVGAANAYSGAIGNAGNLGALYAMSGGGDFSNADMTQIDAGWNAYVAGGGH